jgi:hypothetical protein
MDGLLKKTSYIFGIIYGSGLLMRNVGCIKPEDNIIRMLSGSHPLMLRGGLYSEFLSSVISKNRHQAVVDKLFHSVLEWIVRQKGI